MANEEKFADLDAERLLREFLQDRAAWPLDAKHALETARAHGIPTRTLQSAARRLKIQIRRTGFGRNGRWVWHRPDGIDPDSAASVASMEIVAGISPGDGILTDADTRNQVRQNSGDSRSIGQYAPWTRCARWLCWHDTLQHQRTRLRPRTKISRRVCSRSNRTNSPVSVTRRCMRWRYWSKRVHSRLWPGVLVLIVVRPECHTSTRSARATARSALWQLSSVASSSPLAGCSCALEGTSGRLVYGSQHSATHERCRSGSRGTRDATGALWARAQLLLHPTKKN